MKKIICKYPDGRARIVTPVRNTFGDGGLTDDQIVQRALKNLPPNAIFVRLADESEISKDRSDRDAWVVDTAGAVKVDAALKAAIASKKITV